jgi:hypothetical protein
MSGKPLITTNETWQKIQSFFNENGAKLNIKDLFAKDPARFDKFR